jgi:hypothetical protein
MMLERIYHNDRTVQQAQSVIDYLITHGGREGSLTLFGEAFPAALPENKKTLVKLRVYQ